VNPASCARIAAHRSADGPDPRARGHGREKVRHEWREWGKCQLACVIAAVVLLVLIFVVGTPEQTRQLWAASGWLPRLGWITGIWLVLGPLWSMLSTKIEKLHQNS
jgi:hypothetical protein